MPSMHRSQCRSHKEKKWCLHVNFACVRLCKAAAAGTINTSSSCTPEGAQGGKVVRVNAGVQRCAGQRIHQRAHRRLAGRACTRHGLMRFLAAHSGTCYSKRRQEMGRTAHGIDAAVNDVRARCRTPAQWVNDCCPSQVRTATCAAVDRTEQGAAERLKVTSCHDHIQQPQSGAHAS